jgi:hypothetical protein
MSHWAHGSGWAYAYSTLGVRKGGLERGEGVPFIPGSAPGPSDI